MHSNEVIAWLIWQTMWLAGRLGAAKGRGAVVMRMTMAWGIWGRRRRGKGRQKSDAAYSYLFLFSLFIELQFCLQSAMKCMARGHREWCACMCVSGSCDVQTTN